MAPTHRRPTRARARWCRQPVQRRSDRAHCAAERVDHLYLGSATRPDHDKVNKTALGTARYLTWTEFDSGVPAVEAARADGYQVIAIELTSDALPP